MNKSKLVGLLEFDSLGHRQILSSDGKQAAIDDIVISTGASDGPVLGKKYLVSALPAECEFDGILADKNAIYAADGNKESELEYGMPVFFETDELPLMQRMLHNVLSCESDQIAEILDLSEGSVVFEFAESAQSKGTQYYRPVLAVVGDRHKVDDLGDADMDWLNKNYWSLFGLTFAYLDDYKAGQDAEAHKA